MTKANPNPTPHPKIARNPRFERVSGINFVLQERDVCIIREVYKHRFLTSRHIMVLTPGSEKRLLYRLKCLFHSGYLDRPRQQIRPFTREGSNPMVYALGNKGADFLAQNYNVPRLRTDWTTKNREIKQPQIDHTLMVTDFMICLELACQKFKYAELISQENILARLPRKGDKPLNVFRWQFDTSRQTDGENRKISLALRPDKVFGLYLPLDPSIRNKIYFFLEADRTTMPIMRTSPNSSSYLKKMAAYSEARRRNEYRNLFGTRNVRVLTLARSEERIQNMIKAGKLLDKKHAGSSLFWFARAAEFSLDQPLHIFDEVWQNGRDDKRMSLVL